MSDAAQAAPDKVSLLDMIIFVDAERERLERAAGDLGKDTHGRPYMDRRALVAKRTVQVLELLMTYEKPIKQLIENEQAAARRRQRAVDQQQKKEGAA